jgi:hypothetical protein
VDELLTLESQALAPSSQLLPCSKVQIEEEVMIEDVTLSLAEVQRLVRPYKFSVDAKEG